MRRPPILMFILGLTFAACGDDGAGPSTGPPASIAIAAGNGQVGFVGIALDAPLAVEVRDASGIPVPDVAVEWTIGTGEGSLSAAMSTTDAAGVASITLTLGATPGVNTVIARVASLTPEVFNALALASVVDALGDEFSTNASAGFVPPDLVRLSAAPGAGDLVVVLEFAETVASDDDGGPNAIIGVLDLDTDQNIATGAFPNVDSFRPDPGSTGMSIEYFVEMAMQGSGTYAVRDRNFNAVANITPEFDGTVVTLHIPLSAINDDGYVNMAVVVGTPNEPTDIAPSNGNLGVSN